MPYKHKGLQEGDEIPGFVLPDAEGKFHYSDVLFKGTTLLYFLRGTW